MSLEAIGRAIGRKKSKVGQAESAMGYPRRESNREEMIRRLSKYPSDMSPKQIADAENLPIRTVSRYLAKMRGK